MEQFSHKLLFFLILFFFFHSNCALQETGSTLETYIVHVHPSPSSSKSLLTVEEREHWHKSFLPSDDVDSGETRLIYSYHNVISGFAARLTREELAEMESKQGFLQANPDRLVPLLTTHTPEFLGLRQHEHGLWSDSNFGKGIIIGVLDTGVNPNLPSFHDNGIIPPPPAKWKGSCEFGPSVCNNKLIGARNFIRGLNAMQQHSANLQAPPYDEEGHGTHTASTAAGMFVGNVSIEGQAKGTAVGMAPYAHVAIYKVCGKNGCADSDILAAMDSAIADGVDIMSLSLGGPSQPFYSDSVAIGAFGATEKGIFVSCAAGNSGPSPSTLSNEAPWILTVGASTIDRKIRNMVKLGNGAQFYGESVHRPEGSPSTAVLPIVFPGSNSSHAAVCAQGSLSRINVTGKLVVCDAGTVGRVEKGTVVKQAGGAAMIITNTKVQGYDTFADVHALPASHVSYVDGKKIKSYIDSASTPKASISFKGTVIGRTVLAPVVPYFSSRGPNQADPNILKPDIVGPGMNILAAWPSEIGTPGVKFNIISGTSMATPHLSGIAALLKSSHPDWSPAAIKSAIMTTATKTTNNHTLIPNQNLKPADLFAAGSGHVNPSTASHPGLIYDIRTGDYIAYLCGLQYTDDQVSAVARRAIKCSNIKPVPGVELNYPSFVVLLSDRERVKATRTVTNVGEPRSTYNVQVKAPRGTSVTVHPKKLAFSHAKETASYTVTFAGTGSAGGGNSEGYLRWISTDKKYVVNSPIMVTGHSSIQSM